MKKQCSASRFYDTYVPRKICDCITHMDYHFDLYEFSDARRVQFAKKKLIFLALDHWTIIER